MSITPCTQYYYNGKVVLVSRSNGNGTVDVLVFEKLPLSKHNEFNIPISELIPIDITEDILRKCKDCKGGFDYEFEYRYGKITIQSDGKHFYCIITNSDRVVVFKSPVTYLHEVQKEAMTIMPCSTHPKLKP